MTILTMFDSIITLYDKFRITSIKIPQSEIIKSEQLYFKIWNQQDKDH